MFSTPSSQSVGQPGQAGPDIVWAQGAVGKQDAGAWRLCGEHARDAAQAHRGPGRAGDEVGFVYAGGQRATRCRPAVDGSGVSQRDSRVSMPSSSAVRRAAYSLCMRRRCFEK